jgi:hypothetical protein
MRTSRHRIPLSQSQAPRLDALGAQRYIFREMQAHGSAPAHFGGNRTHSGVWGGSPIRVGPACPI